MTIPTRDLWRCCRPAGWNRRAGIGAALPRWPNRPERPGVGPEVAVYLHAFRRHWLLSLGIGLVLAAAAGVAAWVGVGTRYTASAILVVDMQEKSVLTGQLSTMDRDRFEIFKNQQQNRLLQRFVLLAALRKTEVAKTATVREEQDRGGDPAGRLQGLLSVSFPGKAETMQVSITRADAHEAAILVNSVVDSYLTDVVKVEDDQKRQRLSHLETACAEKEQQIRNTRSELKNLAQSYGTSDSQQLTEVQKLMLGDYVLYHQEEAKRQFEAAELESQLAAQEALLKSVDTCEAPADEVDMMLNNDPVTRELQLQLAFKKREQMMNQGAVVPVKNKYAQKYAQELDGLQREYDAKVDEAKKKVRQRKRYVHRYEDRRDQDVAGTPRGNSTTRWRRGSISKKKIWRRSASQPSTWKCCRRT